MQIKTQVEERPVCASSDHYVNLLLDGKCFSCGAVWGLSEGMAEAIDDEQLKHREAPTDAEIDSMYTLAKSDCTEYRNANSRQSNNRYAA